MDAPLSAIGMSLFDLIKAGPGPSSSHTIAPMRAGADFIQRMQNPAFVPQDVLHKAKGVRVRLFGSLSATGRGHGTDYAVLAGLLGHEPSSCPPEVITDLQREPNTCWALKAGTVTIPLSHTSVVFDAVQHPAPYSNTLVIELLDTPFPLGSTPDGENTSVDGRVLFAWEYYSVGGGFLEWKGWQAPARGKPVFAYHNSENLLACLEHKHIFLHDLMLANETAITGHNASEIRAELVRYVYLMRGVVMRGLTATGFLPGTLGLQRKAATLLNSVEGMRSPDRQMTLLSAYAYAAAEENAAGHQVVTTPTCGASGVLPAMLVFMLDQLGFEMETLVNGLLAAVAIGFIAKHNAGIAGAELGCQGEIGVASAMAAGLLSYTKKGTPLVALNAAEIALEHHLGLTCDPVGGYVQIPCIERNAMGVLKAYAASLIACNEDPKAHKVSFDTALKAMAETGRDMNSKYKETSAGGLAVCVVDC